MKYFNSVPAKTTSIDELELQFKIKLKAFCLFAAKFGYRIEPYSHLTWPKFRSLPSALQQDVYTRFCSYADLCMSSDSDIDDDRSLTWWALQQLGLRPTSDLFDKLQDDDILEVYNHEMIQIYRNWKFFEISSYAMGDLFVYPWPDLYLRDDSITQNLLTRAARVLNGEIKQTTVAQSPQHVVSETISSRHNTLEMQVKYLSPLFDSSGSVAALVAVSYVKKLESAPSVEAPREQKKNHLRLISP